MKERFGKLGLHLVNQAENDIKKINQQTLFQIAEIKKKNRDRAQESLLKMREHFNETFNRLLNNSLSSTLLKIKEEILKSKNILKSELISDLTILIEKKINNNYSNYTNFLLNALENIKPIIDKPPELIITFNSRDYEFFYNHKDKITKIFKNTIMLKKSDKEFTGGFICKVLAGNISYNYTLENQLKKSASIIEIEFSKIFSESETDTKQLENNYLKIIQNQRQLAEEYLQNYE
ncbi:MAG: hypothetical protein KGD67_03245 [Candidatus Lokiarchaeota archaeon]|nr:hypothetical protein [Candidatus Lokiarchaeota archaeon]